MADSVSESTLSRAASPEPPPLPNFSRQQPYRFTWDHASRRQGPGSVYSETTEARGDVIPGAARQILDANLSSLAPGSFPPEWSSSKHGFHAISTVLNNPHKKAAPPKAHSSLPPVPQADLPRVRRKDFDGYIKAIKPEWERFQNNLRTGTETTAISSPVNEIMSPLLPPGSPSTAMPPPSPRTARPLHASSKNIPPLDTVPPIYFDESFNLGDPRTFASVAELPPSSGLHPDARDPASISHALPLLEKLSHYADVVELHLVREISLRSSSFFAALSNLNDLQSESSECLTRISRLRGMLSEVDERTAKRGLEMVRMEKKLRNMETVSEGVHVIKHVGDMIGAAHTLVSAGEWGEALDVIEGIDALWKAGPTPSLPSIALALPAPTPHQRRTPTSAASPLPTVHEFDAPAPPPKSPALPTIPVASLSAFAALPEHLRELSLQIATSLTSDLASILKTDLEQRLGRDEPSSSSSAEVADQILKDRLRPVLQGLMRTKGVKEALGKYRDVVTAEVRAAVTRHLPLSGDDDNNDSAQANGKSAQVSERSNALAQQLRDMSHDQFLSVSKAIFKSLIRCLETVQLQSSLLVEVTQYLAPPPRSPAGGARSPAPVSSPLEESLQASLQDLLGAAAELANTRCGKIIGVRSEQHAALPLADFCAIYEAAWAFVLRSEVLNRKMIVGLRGVMLTQSKAFLATFHAARISQSAKLVEEETWAQVEVSPDSQRTADLIIECAMRDPPQMVLSNASALPATPIATSNGNGHAASPTSNGSVAPTGNSKTLNIEGTTFFAVGATLAVLDLAADYLRTVLSLGSLSSEAVGKVIEFLKAFNSRTCQVVLGAGAMRSAGLKNITAKHLALASQSLAIMIALIPYVRETFRRHLSPKQAVMLVEFDKLKRDFQEHQYEIHEKLVAIMKDRLLVHCKSLQEVQWEQAAEQSGPNAYMKLLVKETETLHKVLSKYLPAQVLELIMTQVLASIKNQLSEGFGSIELQSQAAKDRVLADARYLQDRLGSLKNVGAGIGTTVETVVQERPVPRRSLKDRMSGFVPAAGAAGGTAVSGGASGAAEPGSEGAGSGSHNGVNNGEGHG